MGNFSIGAAYNGSPTGIASFAKCPVCTDIRQVSADAAILGAPFDIAIQGRSGTRLGPRAIRLGSTRFSYRPGGTYDPERKQMYMDSDRWTVVDCAAGGLPRTPEDIHQEVLTIVLDRWSR